MRHAAAALLLSFAATPTLAQEKAIDCENAMAQQEMNFCALQDFEKADKELNDIWKEARAAARALDEEEPDETLRGAERELVAAQRGWIAYRDGSCNLAGWEAHGGSMEPMLISGCLAELTRKRTTELREFIEGPTN